MMEMAAAAGSSLLGNVQDDHGLLLAAASLEAPIAFAVPGPASIVSCHVHQASGSVELRTISGKGAVVRHFSAVTHDSQSAGESDL